MFTRPAARKSSFVLAVAAAALFNAGATQAGGFNVRHTATPAMTHLVTGQRPIKVARRSVLNDDINFGAMFENDSGSAVPTSPRSTTDGGPLTGEIVLRGR